MQKTFILFLIFFIFPASAEIISDFTNTCGMYHIMHAVPRSFDCESGYFLPANSHECVACPNGYTCNGGTYVYNPTESQGIVRNANNPYVSGSEQNTCAANMGHVMNAVYTPKTVTLNFDDGLGNTTTKTCTYDGLVNIPDTPPTRVGYDFAGWKVENNNN